jgi:hypothetical protein
LRAWLLCWKENRTSKKEVGPLRSFSRILRGKETQRPRRLPLGIQVKKGRDGRMRILSIGNSFSQDAQRYLKAIADSQGRALHCVNLYIGGCSLNRHCDNWLSDEKAYQLESNGEASGRLVSIREALASEAWDVVTLQQASHLSEDFRTFVPYIDVLAQAVRRCVPQARLCVHQTWAYEDGSERIRQQGEGKTQETMFENVRNAYAHAVRHIGAQLWIPSGEAMHLACREGVGPVYRDGFHASLGAGRYLLGLTWYQTLTDCRVEKADIALDEAVEPELRRRIVEISQRAARMAQSGK